MAKTIDAFLYVRNFRPIIMNLMTLMIDSELDNLPSEDANRILSQMNERFLPNLSNE